MKDEQPFWMKMSDKAHSLSDKLSDRQYAFVDWCVDKALWRLAEELKANGDYECSVEELVLMVEDALHCECLTETVQYEEWYDKDEETCIGNIIETVDETWGDRDSMIEEQYTRWKESK